MKIPACDDRSTEAIIHRREMLTRVGLTFCAATVLGERFAFSSESDGHNQEFKEDGLWFEWTDGTYYRHELVLDGQGLWLSEHDGYSHFYQDYELQDGGIWLTRADGSCEYHRCLTDVEAEDRLDGLYWINV